MGSLSIWHWLVVGAILLLVFGGRGKISDMMGDVAKGIKSFKKGLSEDDADETPKSDAPAMKSINNQTTIDAQRRAEAKTKVESSLP